MSARHAPGRGRRRGGHEEEHENHERWMVTYADMLTLLLVLFIVLYAMGQVNTSKFDQLKSSLASAFNNGQQSVLTGGNGVVGSMAQPGSHTITFPTIPKIRAGIVSPASQLTEAKIEADEFAQIEKAIRASLHARHLDGDAEFSVDERGLVVTVLTDELVFAGNSAVLESQGTVILSAVVTPLKKVDNQVQVDGHTNQAKVSTYPYPSGWELSSARASSVVRYLIGAGISSGRLSAVGYSDQRPLISASDPRSITRNRRVDIVVLSKLSAADRAQLPSLANSARGPR